MPTTAAAAPGAAPADAPIADRVGETPVASDRLNVKPAPPANQYLGIKCAPVSSAAPVLGRAPQLAGTRASRSAARDFGVYARSPRSSRAGRSNGRKNFLVITLAPAPTAFASGGFRLRTRSR